MAIKVIETRYAGCRFRSRLEARWAVFFDALGLRWDYEPQGYVIDGEPYLPDFLLPGLRLFVEVKPWGFDATEDAAVVKRHLRVLSETIQPAMLVCGDPCDYRSHWFGQDTTDSSGGCSDEEGGWSAGHDGRDRYAHFSVDHLGRPNVALGLMGWSSRTIVDAEWNPICHYGYDDRDMVLVGRCASAARAARFEFNGAWRQGRMQGIVPIDGYEAAVERGASQSYPDAHPEATRPVLLDLFA